MDYAPAVQLICKLATVSLSAWTEKRLATQVVRQGTWTALCAKVQWALSYLCQGKDT